jgi:hypothetical protein
MTSSNLLSIISAYKSRIAQSHLQDEVYKWELVSKFKGRPDTNASDFEKEYKSVKFGNLIYAMAIATGNFLVSEHPEELRSLFKHLFDETLPLNDRVEYFNTETLRIYKLIEGKHSHHQDERSISAYLTFHNPEKYTFYKNGFYVEFCKLMGVAPAGKNKKYSHYLELLNEFIQKYIVPDKELIEQVKSYIPAYYDGTNHLLLAQDILYSMLDKTTDDANYWVFQGNPKIYNIVEALNNSELTTWSVKSHKESIKIGDKIILWVTGNDSGCYGLGEVKSEMFDGIDDENQMKYYTDKSVNEIASRVKIQITHNFSNQPILKNDLASLKQFDDFKGGNQGTNFSATKEQFEAFLKLSQEKTENSYWIYAPGENAFKWPEFFEAGIMALGWDQLGDLNSYASKEEIAQALREHDNTDGSKKNDALANYEFKEIMKVGNVILVKKGTQEFLGVGIVKSDYYFEKDAADYKSRRKVEWIKNGLWNDPVNKTVLKTLTNITQYKEYVAHLKSLIGIGEQTKLNISMKKDNPINKILYGPPGTGKTYTLKTDYFPIYTTKETALSKEQHFEEIVRDLTWWQVVAVALIQSGKSKVGNLLKHPWILQKAKLSNSNTVRPTLWGQLQSHTIDTCEFVNVKAKQQPFIFNKTEDSYWEILQDEVKEQSPEIYELIDSVENFNPNPDKEIKRYVFTTFHQSFNYEDFIEGIKPVLADEEGNGEVSYRIEDGIFKDLCKRAESDPENRYAIFIDEINRGNVSAIFGELITLIETDKRKGAEHAMSATLPYSKKQFSVPSNVDIYGTMNTADRSVEALDTALRRRFSFEEMLPQPSLLKDKGENKSGKVGAIDIEKLLITINERIDALVDRDHTIGHAFFMNVDSLESLQNTFAKNVIPLLQEYFYGDYAKMEMVIGPDFFNKDKRQKKVTFAVSNEDIEIPLGSYELMNVMNTDFDIEAAIKRLLASN